jgi:predicted TIM-barrel fold metal-dependent hydrolase
MATSKELLDSMDQAGVDASIIAGIGWTNIDLARDVNDYLLKAAAGSGGRLLAFCSLNPAWGSAVVVEAQRCIEAGATGIGELHPDSQRFDLSEKTTMAPLMDIAERHGLPVLVHASEPVGHAYDGKGNTTPRLLWDFVQNFPDNAIILAHWGGGLPFYSLMPEVGKALTNVYFDSAASPFLYRPSVYATVAGLVGAERVMWASDFPLLDQVRSLDELADQPLTDQERRFIEGGNAARLLGLG